LSAGQLITIGNTSLQVLPTSDHSRQSDSDNSISVQSMRAAEPAFSTEYSMERGWDRRLAFLYDLPLQFRADLTLDGLLDRVVRLTVDAIIGAKRGAILLLNEGSDGLELGASSHAGEPAISFSLAQKALKEQVAFIWPPSPDSESPTSSDQVPSSVTAHNVQSAMYAPFVWEDRVHGVICVDNSERGGAFSVDDLRLLNAVAHHAAAALASLDSRTRLQRQSEFMQRLFSSRFPPAIRGRLLEAACAKTVPAAPVRTKVTVLVSDIRGFTQLTAKLGASQMADLIGEYFSTVIDVVFAHGGSIERFVGDAIFAVFGTPEPDPKQTENAIRAAIEMQEALRTLSASRSRRGVATCGFGTGIDCGEVLHGFFGNSERLEFNVIGNAANRASRLCSGAQAGEVLISQEVYKREFRSIDSEPTVIATKHEGDLPAHRLLGLKNRAQVRSHQ
jgi:adenylate cyclase